MQVTPENRGAIEAAKSYDNNDTFGLLIHGPAGTGKTHLVCALINQEVERCRKRIDQSWPLPKYYNASEFMSQCKKNNFEIDKRDVMTPGWFILDDLGVENITDWSLEILYRAFEIRCSQRLHHTFITTNLSIKELKERLRERTVSRILDLCAPLEMKGEDYRRNRLSQNLKGLYQKKQTMKGME
jgi:DNA replication protein DnaC